MRNILLLQIFGSSAFFVAGVFGGMPLPPVDIEEFQTIGMISMASVAIYFSMMSIYFAQHVPRAGRVREGNEFARLHLGEYAAT